MSDDRKPLTDEQRQALNEAILKDLNKAAEEDREELRLRPARNGCTCSCHRHAGIIHCAPCC